MSNQITVLIVDDSALIRAILTEIISQDDRLTVIGEAIDPYDAREKIKLLSPDVLTLDIEMPKMNGIAFLKNLMRLRPMPVVMVSTLTQVGAPAALEALEIGAVDFVPKPQTTNAVDLAQYKDVIIEKLVNASRANITKFTLDQPRDIPRSLEVKSLKSNFICAIGASTGGTEAIKKVLQALPKKSPPIVITQHIPGTFSESFTRRVDQACEIKVYHAMHRQPIEAGCAYIAPGDFHLLIKKTSLGYQCMLSNTEPVNRHRPAVDVLYQSVLAQTRGNCMGVLLTGMGSDGAKELLAMRQAGCMTIAQDEASSVVWGMPGAAVNIEAAQYVLPLERISNAIMKQARG